MFTKVLRSLGMRGRVLTLDAPISGDVIPLSEVNDQTFATGLFPLVFADSRVIFILTPWGQ